MVQYLHFRILKFPLILARKGFRSTRALNYPVYQRKPHLFQSVWINMKESTKPWQLYRKRKNREWRYQSFCMNIHMNITDAGILEPELMKIWLNIQYMNHSETLWTSPPKPPPDLPGTHGTPGWVVPATISLCTWEMPSRSTDTRPWWRPLSLDPRKERSRPGRKLLWKMWNEGNKRVTKCNTNHQNI